MPNHYVDSVLDSPPTTDAEEPIPFGRQPRVVRAADGASPADAVGAAGVMAVGLRLEPIRVAGVMLLATFAWGCGATLGEATRFLDDQDQIAAVVGESLRQAFGPGGEVSVGAWYSATALMFCAGLLAVVAVVERARGAGSVRHWWGLSAIFVFLSCDEAAAIHEWVGIKLKGLFEATGYLSYEWVIPYAAFALAVGLVYLPFVVRLPARTRALFLVAGALYVGGALVLESVQARIVEGGGEWSVRHSILALIEESMEMTGITVFAFALLSYLAARATIRLDFGNR